MGTHPHVRAIVVNHNGGDQTFQCLDALAQTSWPRDKLELVLVDNASTDGLLDRLEHERPQITVIRSDRNLGFGGANNLALRDRGPADYVALVNPDAFVTPAWLDPLAEALGSNSRLGAACPKIVLTGRYGSLTLASSTHRRGRADKRRLGVRITGVRVDDDEKSSRTRYIDGTWGVEPGGRWTNGLAKLGIPVGNDSSQHEVSVRLDSVEPTVVTIRSRLESKQYTVGTAAAWYDCTIDSGSVVINNVGTELVEDGYAADRGWLEPDDGQFDDPADVFAWCGGAVLLRGAYLDDVGLFDERLFLYYEDLELAWRGRARGWRYRTVPSSVVAHEHAASTVEGSALSDHFNERNHLLVIARHGSIPAVTRSWIRYVLITASYARRDLLQPLLGGRLGDPTIVRRRVRALLSAIVRAPAMLHSRRRDTRKRARRYSP